MLRQKGLKYSLVYKQQARDRSWHGRGLSVCVTLEKERMLEYCIMFLCLYRGGKDVQKLRRYKKDQKFILKLGKVF